MHGTRFQPGRRRVLAASAGLSIAALAGCIGGTDDDEDPEVEDYQYDREEPDDEETARGGSLTFLQSEERDDDYDPVHTFDSYSQQVVNLLFDSLYEWTDELELEPNIATDFPEEERDGERWLFEIRDDAEFHNGDPVTAEDCTVMFTQTIEEESPLITQYEMVEDVEHIDDHSFQVDLEHPFGPWEMMTMAVPAIPREHREDVGPDEFNEDPVGCGPFQWADYQPGEYVVLERWDDYWGEPMPYLEEIEFRHTPDDSSRISQILAGDVDLIEEIPSGAWDEVDDADDVRLHIGESPSYMYLAFNCNDGETTDPDVRRAVAHSFSLRDFVEDEMGVTADPLVSPIPEITDEGGGWDFPMEEWEEAMPDYDPDEAEALLEEAGVPDDWEPIILAPEGGAREALAERVAVRLEEIGYGAHVNAVGFGTLVEQSRTGNADDYEMYLLGWTGGPDPDAYYYNLLHESGEELTQGHFYEGQGEFHDRIEEARLSTDQDDRRELYVQVTEEIIEYLPMLPAYTEHNTLAAGDHVRDLHVHPEVSTNPRFVSEYGNVWLDE